MKSELSHAVVVLAGPVGPWWDRIPVIYKTLIVIATIAVAAFSVGAAWSATFGTSGQLLELRAEVATHDSLDWHPAIGVRAEQLEENQEQMMRELGALNELFARFLCRETGEEWAVCQYQEILNRRTP